MRSKINIQYRNFFDRAIVVLLIFCFTFFLCTGTGQIFALSKNEFAGEYSQLEIIVKFKKSAFKGKLFSDKTRKFNSVNSRKLVPAYNLKVTKSKQNIKKKLGLDRVFKVELKPGKSVKESIAKYEKSPYVEYANPNYKINYFVVPNDTLYGSQWHLPQINAEEAWDIQQGDPAITVAVVDSGVDWNHPDLDADIWTNAGDQWGDPSDPNSGNGIDDDGNGYIDDYKGWDFFDTDNDPMDEFGHGTHVAGIAAAVTNNATGVAGAGWNVKIMPLRTYWLDDSYSAIEYAVDNGADVINASWGVFFDDETLRDWINYARDNGVVFVAAAGNDMPYYGYPWEYPIYPALYNGVISVAATNSSDQRASFSNYGSWISISAPGEDIYSTDWDDTYNDPPGSGTSYSSPLVVGVAGLLKSEETTWSYKRIFANTQNRVDNIMAQNPGYENKLGHGRINAERVLTASPNHPTGSLVTATSTSKVYYLSGNTKRWIINPSVFTTQFDWQDIIWIDPSELDSYVEGPNYRYPDGTLISNGGKVYVIEYQLKRWITSPEIFLGLGYQWSNIVAVSDSIANDFSTGPDLSSIGYHPSGSIITASGDPKVYVLDNGRKHWIENPEIYLRNYKSWDRIIWVSSAEKSSYPDGSSVGRYDGSLIANATTNKVYVIEFGEKRWITSPAVFESLGYEWENRDFISDSELTIYPDGPDIT